MNLTIKNVKNSCGTSQVDVLRIFTTQIEISGRVTNNLDGKGIYGVTVTLTGGSCSGTCGNTTTNLNGDFAFYGFPAGIYTLTETDLPGYISVSDSQGDPTDNQVTLTVLAGDQFNRPLLRGYTRFLHSSDSRQHEPIQWADRRPAHHHHPDRDLQPADEHRRRRQCPR